ncbi:MAG TPA: STAS domain-containing protein [Streptosporangiaceae bacterium]|nr:STAS domain-containing protein [Streptosporangiaceae bacterium]
MLVELPEQVDQSNAGQIRDQLLAIIDRQAQILLVDMTGTTGCDYACGDALARVFQRAMARGIGLRLIANVDNVLRVLSMCGLDRVIPVCGTVGAALHATAPADTVPVSLAPQDRAAPSTDPGFPAGDVGVEIALLDADGVIVWVNSAWRAFTAANGGDPAAAGPGVSYLDVCAAAAGDLVTARVEAAIRRALTGDLPGSFTIEVPCHSPGTARWFDMLISSRLDQDGGNAGATVTLSLARAQARALLAAGQPGPGEPGRDLVSGMADRLTAVSDLLEVTATRAPAPISGQLYQAISELTTVIHDARTASPEPRP